MNDLNSENLFGKPDDVKLTSREREEMRDKLLAFMKGRPFPKPGLSFKMRQFLAFGLAALLLIIPAMAERAVPGQFLYPVKTQVNEKVLGLFYVSESARGDWEVKLSEKRLYEAEAVAVSPQITVEIQNQAQQNFKKQASQANQHIEKLKTEGKEISAIEAGTKLTFALEAHQQALNNLSSTLPQESKTAVENLQQEVESKKTETALVSGVTNASNAPALVSGPSDEAGFIALSQKNRVDAQVAMEEAKLQMTAMSPAGHDSLKAKEMLAKAEDYYLQGENTLLKSAFKRAAEHYLVAFNLARGAIAILAVKPQIEAQPAPQTQTPHPIEKHGQMKQLPKD